MAWDDELERLTLQVVNDVGGDAFQQALLRAVAAAFDNRGLSSLDDLRRWTSTVAFQDVLKAELRRLARRH
jgi:hypothetical protein